MQIAHRVPLRWLTALPLMAAACSSAVVSLGDQNPPKYSFGPAELIPELSDPVAKTDNPTLTADLRDIFFTSERGGGPAEIWTATRAEPTDRFGAPELVTAVNSPSIETSPIVSGDGLTLWLGSDRSGGRGDLDIWVSSRKTRTAAWSAPENLDPLNSTGKDIPRLPGQHDLVMPLGSDRAERNYYSIFFATRESGTAAFESPEIVQEVSARSVSTIDGFLTEDGTALFYVSGPAFGAADMFVRARRTTSEAFGDAMPLDGLNTSNDERDPWLTADGKQLYFSSDRSGHYEIYVATMKRDPP